MDQMDKLRDQYLGADLQRNVEPTTNQLSASTAQQNKRSKSTFQSNKAQGKQHLLANQSVNGRANAKLSPRRANAGKPQQLVKPRKVTIEQLDPEQLNKDLEERYRSAKDDGNQQQKANHHSQVSKAANQQQSRKSLEQRMGNLEKRYNQQLEPGYQVKVTNSGAGPNGVETIVARKEGAGTKRGQQRKKAQDAAPVDQAQSLSGSPGRSDRGASGPSYVGYGTETVNDLTQGVVQRLEASNNGLRGQVARVQEQVEIRQRQEQENAKEQLENDPVLNDLNQRQRSLTNQVQSANKKLDKVRHKYKRMEDILTGQKYGSPHRSDYGVSGDRGIELKNQIHASELQIRELNSQLLGFKRIAKVQKSGKQELQDATYAKNVNQSKKLFAQIQIIKSQCKEIHGQLDSQKQQNYSIHKQVVNVSAQLAESKRLHAALKQAKPGDTISESGFQGVRKSARSRSSVRGSSTGIGNVQAPAASRSDIESLRAKIESNERVLVEQEPQLKLWVGKKQAIHQGLKAQIQQLQDHDLQKAREENEQLRDEIQGLEKITQTIKQAKRKEEQKQAKERKIKLKIDFLNDPAQQAIDYRRRKEILMEQLDAPYLYSHQKYLPGSLQKRTVQKSLEYDQKALGVRSPSQMEPISSQKQEVQNAIAKRGLAVTKSAAQLHSRESVQSQISKAGPSVEQHSAGSTGSRKGSSTGRKPGIDSQIGEIQEDQNEHIDNDAKDLDNYSSLAQLANIAGEDHKLASTIDVQKVYKLNSIPQSNETNAETTKATNQYGPTRVTQSTILDSYLPQPLTIGAHGRPSVARQHLTMTGLRKANLDRILAVKSQQKITLEPIDATDAALRVARERYDSIVARPSGDELNSRYSYSQAYKDSVRSSMQIALEPISVTDQKRRPAELVNEYADRGWRANGGAVYSLSASEKGKSNARSQPRQPEAVRLQKGNLKYIQESLPGLYARRTIPYNNDQQMADLLVGQQSNIADHLPKSLQKQREFMKRRSKAVVGSSNEKMNRIEGRKNRIRVKTYQLHRNQSGTKLDQSNQEVKQNADLLTIMQNDPVTSEDGAGRYMSAERDADEAKPKEKHTMAQPVLITAVPCLEEDLNEQMKHLPELEEDKFNASPNAGSSESPRRGKKTNESAQQRIMTTKRSSQSNESLNVDAIMNTDEARRAGHSRIKSQPDDRPEQVRAAAHASEGEGDHLYTTNGFDKFVTDQSRQSNKQSPHALNNNGETDHAMKNPSEQKFAIQLDLETAIVLHEPTAERLADPVEANSDENDGNPNGGEQELQIASGADGPRPSGEPPTVPDSNRDEEEQQPGQANHDGSDAQQQPDNLQNVQGSETHRNVQIFNQDTAIQNEQEKIKEQQTLQQQSNDAQEIDDEMMTPQIGGQQAEKTRTVASTTVVSMDAKGQQQLMNGPAESTDGDMEINNANIADQSIGERYREVEAALQGEDKAQIRDRLALDLNELHKDNIAEEDQAEQEQQEEASEGHTATRSQHETKAGRKLRPQGRSRAEISRDIETINESVAKVQQQVESTERRTTDRRRSAHASQASDRQHSSASGHSHDSLQKGEQEVAQEPQEPHRQKSNLVKDRSLKHMQTAEPGAEHLGNRQPKTLRGSLPSYDRKHSSALDSADGFTEYEAGTNNNSPSIHRLADPPEGSREAGGSVIEGRHASTSSLYAEHEAPIIGGGHNSIQDPEEEQTEMDVKHLNIQDSNVS